jgi:hypothetical protein
VIARRGGGALETIQDGVTGCFWSGGAADLAATVHAFDGSQRRSAELRRQRGPLRRLELPQRPVERGRRRARRGPDAHSAIDGRRPAPGSSNAPRESGAGSALMPGTDF